MNSNRQSRAYEALAELAARQAGLEPATAEAAAQDAGAKAARDALWMEFDIRLVDEQTYTLDEVVAWCTGELKADVSRMAVYRARVRKRDEHRAYRLRAQLAQQTADAIGEGGEIAALKASRAVAAQLLFDSLRGMTAENLDGLKPAQILKLIDTVGSLSKADVETEVRRAQLADMRRAFDEAVKARSGAGRGELTGDDIDEIRTAVFGEVA